jgi:phage tail-like protein
MAKYEAGKKVAAKAYETGKDAAKKKLESKGGAAAKAWEAAEKHGLIDKLDAGIAKILGIEDKPEVTAPEQPKPRRGMVTPFDDTPDLDPWGNYRFSLYLHLRGGELTEVAHFMECTGLKSSAEVFEIREGGLNGRSHKRPGQSRWENITLRYGTSADNQLAAWRDRYLLDTFTSGERKSPRSSSGAIVMMDNSGRPLRRYEFKNAWPVAWEGPSLNAGGSELAVESLEIAHAGLKVVEETRGANDPLEELVVAPLEEEEEEGLDLV